MEPVYPEAPDATQMEEQRTTRQMTSEEIMALPLSSLIDIEIRDMVMNRQKASQQWRMPKRLIWDKCWSHYKQIYDRANKAKWQSTTFMPLTTKTVETIVASLHATILGPEMPVEWQTRNRPDLDQSVAKHNQVMGYDMEKSKFKPSYTDSLRNLTLCGTSIGKIDYVKQSEQVMIKERRQPSMLDSILQKFGKSPQLERFMPKQMLVKDHARYRDRDIYDIYPQPYSTEITKDTWLIEKGTITNKELMDGSLDQDDYYRLDNVTPDVFLKNGSTKITEDPEKQIRRIAFLDYQIYPHHLEPDVPHELLEYYGPIPAWFLDPELRNDEKRKYDTVPGWIWVVDGQHVVRKRLSWCRDGEPPYTKGNYIKVPNQFYGIGVGELLMGLQIEKNELRNLRIDNVNILMNKIIAVLKDKVPQGEWNRLVSEPGAVWVFHQIDDVRKAIQMVEFPDMTKDAYLSSREVDAEAEEVTGANKATIGVGGSQEEAGGGTFRGQLMNAQMAGQRFMLYARTLEWMGLGDAIKKYYQRIYQFKSYQEIEEILGKDAQGFDLIAPELLEKVARLVPIGSVTMENKGVKLAQMNQFALMWKDQPWFKAWDMARKQWIEMGHPDPDSITFSEQEMKQFIQFKQAMTNAGSMTPPPMPGGEPNVSGPSANTAPAQPVAGDTVKPPLGMPRVAMPARGPGASSIDSQGTPLS